MNEPNKSEIVEKHNLSIVRKTQLIVAIIGAIGTIIVLVVAFYLLNNAPKPVHGDDATALNGGEAILILISLPFIIIYKLFGGTSSLGSESDFTHKGAVLFSIVALNTLISFIVGYFIGRIIEKFKQSKKL